MGLPKGRTNNAKGKPKGALNKLPKDLKQTINDFLISQWPEVVKEFTVLKGRDKVNFYRDLLQFVIPKMKDVSMDIDVTLDRLSEADLDIIINRLLTDQKK
ncbi:MAG TPA: hypothetical protein VMW76_09015 [Bacteroidales bacterium]|nr:hypothetical protein [Bacteroidales bacterium]